MITALATVVLGTQALLAREEALERDLLKRVNAVRSQAGLSVLDAHPALSASALALARDLADRGVLEHRDRRGWKLAERVEEAGYRNWTALGENIAFGQKTANEAVDDWLNSQGHRRMIYDSGFAETGIAVVSAKNGARYWVQQFGTR